MLLYFFQTDGVLFFMQALNKLVFTSVCLIYVDSDAQFQMCCSHFYLCVCVCVFALCALPTQTRCLISLGWVMLRSTPGRMPPSSVSPRAKFPRVSPSSWRWEQVIFFIIFAWAVSLHLSTCIIESDWGWRGEEVHTMIKKLCLKDKYNYIKNNLITNSVGLQDITCKTRQDKIKYKDKIRKR